MNFQASLAAIPNEATNNFVNSLTDGGKTHLGARRYGVGIDQYTLIDGTILPYSNWNSGMIIVYLSTYLQTLIELNIISCLISVL